MLQMSEYNELVWDLTCQKEYKHVNNILLTG